MPTAPNILDRKVTVEAPNAVWAADVTYLPTLEGWLNLAVLLDLHSRRVVGWAMSERNDEALTLAALKDARHRREHGDILSLRSAARREVTDYILGFYNPTRLHSYLGYMSPMEFERGLKPVSTNPGKPITLTSLRH